MRFYGGYKSLKRSLKKKAHILYKHISSSLIIEKLLMALFLLIESIVLYLLRSFDKMRRYIRHHFQQPLMTP